MTEVFFFLTPVVHFSISSACFILTSRPGCTPVIEYLIQQARHFPPPFIPLFSSHSGGSGRRKRRRRQKKQGSGVPHRDESETDTRVGWVSEWTLPSPHPRVLIHLWRRKRSNRLRLLSGCLHSALRWCCSRIAWRLSPPRWRERGGFADQVEVPFWDFFGLLSEEKPRRDRKFPFCRCVEGAEDVGAEHYGPDHRCSAQCHRIRRVQNSVQGHHSRSHGPEKETLGLWVSSVRHSFRK